ncbi:MAG TPA: cyclic peptide export ABC transporter [Candidatus Angelobacter sp.]|nr:cyclic peptide export ABC transporter [Candidatus Angelobacter sp.]
MQLILFLLARSRQTLSLAIAFGFLSGGFNAGMLALTNAAIAIPSRRSGIYLAAFIGLCVLAPLARMFSEILLVSLGQDAVFRLRKELSRQMIEVPLDRLEQVGSHRVLSVLTDDIPNIANAVAYIPVLSINAGVIVGSLCYMGWLEWRLLAAVLAFMALGIVTYQAGVSHAMSHLKHAREHENTLQKRFRGLIHGIKELKMHRRRRNAFLTTALEETADECRSANVSGLSIYSAASSWGQLLVFATLGLLVFALAPVLGVAVGVLTGFGLALLYMTTPLQVIMNSVPTLARANVAVMNAQSLGLMLTLSARPSENTPLGDIRPVPEQLELSEVTYSYSSDDAADQFLLGPVNLRIEAGELLFITGGNGSGKTTLGKLLVGLYAPESGEIHYNHKLIDDSHRDGYRQLFAAVFNDPFLFESLLGLEKSQIDKRAREYLACLHLDHKVSVKDGVFSTTDLSQGQRKRLALLTCYLEDRPIYFFDEWAADQDPKFKEVFYRQILPGLKSQGKTVIVVSHDDRYYEVADRIVTLESGRLSRIEETTVFRPCMISTNDSPSI